jgi:thiamine-monophosphate kinase
MNGVIENSFIEALVRDLPKSPYQRNGLQESDSELIMIPGTETILAITTDSIVEEIETGLYSDPFLIGWMTVMVNASDLAAVGADPLGILLNETLPDSLSESFIREIQSGIKEACEFCNMPVLGGDTNHSNSFQMGGTAIGIVSKNRLVTRIGCQPGDILFISAKPGSGNSFAFSLLADNSSGALPVVSFKPYARLTEGKLLVDYATCCMDSSDGFIATIDQLMRSNNKGFIIDILLQDFIHPETLNFSHIAKIPPWMFLAGIHGEFELVFTVPPEKVTQFTTQAQTTGWHPIRLGTVVKERELQMRIDDTYIKVDTTRIRNLFDKARGNIQEYIGELFKIDQEWKSHTIL